MFSEDTKALFDDIWNQISNRIQIVEKRLRLVKINRNFLVFLIFLAISAGFWVLTALKEEATYQVDYKINIEKIPSDFILTEDIPTHLNVTLEGKTSDIIRFTWKWKWWVDDAHVITLEPKEVSTKDGIISISNQDIKKAIRKVTPASLKIQSTLPASLRIFYSTGEIKRVPVFFNGKVTPATQRMLNNINITTDSVDVLAPRKILDSINSVRTAFINETNIQDTLRKRVPLEHISGVKLIPDSVEVEYCVDVFTEKTLEISNIYFEGGPQNMMIRTFPMKVQVRFHVSAALFDSIKPEDFIISVDYKSIKEGDKTCHLNIVEQPECISHAVVIPSEVEFVLEQEDDSPM